MGGFMHHQLFFLCAGTSIVYCIQHGKGDKCIRIAVYEKYMELTQLSTSGRSSQPMIIWY